jgi:DNA-nicking Smr family endonuclease
MRTVLVVPGRGRNSPNGMGVLREKLPHWLTQEPFKRVVLPFGTARSHDGVLGGIYLLLRKYR